MGYDLHITRKSDWPLRGNDISIQEWLAILAADPELTQDGCGELWWKLGKETTVKDQSLAMWTAWSGHVPGESVAFFHLWNGNIESKNPDEEIRRKMWRIAQLLNARVQGDDGEFYDELGNGAYEELPPIRPEELPPDIEEPHSQKASSWLKRLLRPFSRGPN